MPRVEVPVTRTSRVQVFCAPTSSAGDPANGHFMVNDGASSLWVRSAAAGDETLSTFIVESLDGQVPGPVVLTVPANCPGTMLGPFPVDLYGSVLSFDVSTASFEIMAFTLL